ncbi:MAG: signal peptidase I, partial [Clostridia bacterium]|nr:signal peptidase I [Clostridia bacterium]
MENGNDTKLNIQMPSEKEILKERRRLQYGKEYRKVLATTIYTILVVAAIAILIVTLVLPVLQVSGNSMEPTFKDGDVVLLIRTEKLETGDICGFYWNNKLLLKRVIGTPGDIIKMDASGNIYVNDFLLDESYISEKAYGECCNIEFP